MVSSKTKKKKKYCLSSTASRYTQTGTGISAEHFNIKDRPDSYIKTEFDSDLPDHFGHKFRPLSLQKVKMADVSHIPVEGTEKINNHETFN